jgi:D-alanyl-D-alanine endopeptidase (penicillin-binding protein 7)
MRAAMELKRGILLLVVATFLPWGMSTAEAGSSKTHHVQAKAKSKVKSKSQSKAHHARRAHRHPIRHASASPSSPTIGGLSLNLQSSAALVVDQSSGKVLYGKNTEARRPIASITKLMTSMVVLDAQLPLDEEITITEDDVDHLRNTTSRLKVGTTLSRRLLMQLALMSSENRAAAALGRNYPGGIHAFVAAMNQKAAALGMRNTSFVDSSGLNSDNTSTAQDLALMVRAAYRYDLIREMTTTPSYDVAMYNRGRMVEFRNTNMLVRSQAKSWHIGLSKTGFINEAGHCLVMQAKIAQQPTIIVLLDSWGKFSRIGDANRIKKWMESSGPAKQRFG